MHDLSIYSHYKTSNSKNTSKSGWNSGMIAVARHENAREKWPCTERCFVLVSLGQWVLCWLCTDFFSFCADECAAAVWIDRIWLFACVKALNSTLWLGALKYAAWCLSLVAAGLLFGVRPESRKAETNITFSTISHAWKNLHLTCLQAVSINLGFFTKPYYLYMSKLKPFWIFDIFLLIAKI